jgi:hypothetical protein
MAAVARNLSLGGPDPAERTALAIATVTRHPGLALLIATASFPKLQVMPPILSLIIGCALVSIPYTAWRKRILAAQPNAAPRAVSAR